MQKDIRKSHNFYFTKASFTTYLQFFVKQKTSDIKLNRQKRDVKIENKYDDLTKNKNF